jgi:hypothetical protein
MGIAIAQNTRNIILVLLRRDCPNKRTAEFMVANFRPHQGYLPLLARRRLIMSLIQALLQVHRKQTEMFSL